MCIRDRNICRQSVENHDHYCKYEVLGCQVNGLQEKVLQCVLKGTYDREQVNCDEACQYHKHDTDVYKRQGVEGSKKIGHIMNILRANVPEEVAGYKTRVVRDYRLEYIRNIETGEVKPTGFPNANVLYYELENDAWLAVRPSGTEPKIKFYYGIKGSSYDEAQKESAAFGDKVMDLILSLIHI